MKSTIKILFTIFSILILNNGVKAQSNPGLKLKYYYDENGNRIERSSIVVTIIGKYNPSDDSNRNEEPLAGKNELHDFKISIGPNPTNNIVIIELSNTNDKEKPEFAYTIFASNGTLIKEGNIADWKTNLDFSTLNDGIYMLKLVSKSKTNIYKIVKTIY